MPRQDTELRAFDVRATYFVMFGVTAGVDLSSTLTQSQHNYTELTWIRQAGRTRLHEPTSRF